MPKGREKYSENEQKLKRRTDFFFQDSLQKNLNLIGVQILVSVGDTLNSDTVEQNLYICLILVIRGLGFRFGFICSL